MRIEIIVYLCQIVLLLACIPPLVLCLYMVNRSRLAINGLHRSLMLLLSMLIVLIVLLIVRRVDDAFGVLDDRATLMLSSGVMILMVAIVTTVTMDFYYLYRNRDLYAILQANRRKKIEELESLRQKNERLSGIWRA